MKEKVLKEGLYIVRGSRQYEGKGFRRGLIHRALCHGNMKEKVLKEGWYIGVYVRVV